MTKLQHRIEKLENKHADEERNKGVRTFQQDGDNASLFFELPSPFFTSERPYTREEISALSADGWTCILVVYGRS